MSVAEGLNESWSSSPKQVTHPEGKNTNPLLEITQSNLQADRIRRGLDHVLYQGVPEKVHRVIQYLDEKHFNRPDRR